MAAALPAAWQAAPTHAEPAGPPRRPSARVWKVCFAGGRALALKLSAPGAPVDTEAQALRWLGVRRAPVPAVLATSSHSPASWLALEWCGDTTLDDAAQGASASRRAGLGRRLARSVAAVERAFAPLQERIWGSSPPGREREAGARARALRAQAAPWLEAAPATLEWLTGHPPGPEVQRALAATLRTAVNAEPSLGSLDYNPRNAVLDRRRLTLLDFAAIGADWPERRFVQYGTAVGAGLPDGNFASVVGPATTLLCAEEVAPLRRLSVRAEQRVVDAHDVLLLLTAAGGLRAVALREAHPGRAAGWSNVPQRRARLQELLRRRLVPDGPAEDLRACLRRLPAFPLPAPEGG